MNCDWVKQNKCFHSNRTKHNRRDQSTTIKTSETHGLTTSHHNATMHRFLMLEILKMLKTLHEQWRANISASNWNHHFLELCNSMSSYHRDKDWPASSVYREMQVAMFRSCWNWKVTCVKVVVCIHDQDIFFETRHDQDNHEILLVFVEMSVRSDDLIASRHNQRRAPFLCSCSLLGEISPQI